MEVTSTTVESHDVVHIQLDVDTCISDLCTRSGLVRGMLMARIIVKSCAHTFQRDVYIGAIRETPLQRIHSRPRTCCMEKPKWVCMLADAHAC